MLGGQEAHEFLISSVDFKLPSAFSHGLLVFFDIGSPKKFRRAKVLGSMFLEDGIFQWLYQLGQDGQVAVIKKKFASGLFRQEVDSFKCYQDLDRLN